MNKRRLIILLLLSFTGWLFSSAMLYNYMSEQQQHLESISTENAYNIVIQALRKKRTQQEIVQTMQYWFENEWTAQTGSVTTLCEYGRDKLRKILTEEGVTTVCRLHI